MKTKLTSIIMLSTSLLLCACSDTGTSSNTNAGAKESETEIATDEAAAKSESSTEESKTSESVSENENQTEESETESEGQTKESETEGESQTEESASESESEVETVSCPVISFADDIKFPKGTAIGEFAAGAGVNLCDVYYIETDRSTWDQPEYDGVDVLEEYKHGGWVELYAAENYHEDGIPYNPRNHFGRENDESKDEVIVEDHLWLTNESADIYTNTEVGLNNILTEDAYIYYWNITYKDDDGNCSSLYLKQSDFTKEEMLQIIEDSYLPKIG